MLPKEKGLLVPNLLADAGAEKLTFVGGEPTLCPWLIELIAAAKTAGLTTCLVTNGSRLTEEFLDTCVGILDWIGLSIDASNDELHYRIGRGRRRDGGRPCRRRAAGPEPALGRGRRGGRGRRSCPAHRVGALRNGRAGLGAARLLRHHFPVPALLDPFPDITGAVFNGHDDSFFDGFLPSATGIPALILEILVRTAIASGSLSFLLTVRF